MTSAEDILVIEKALNSGVTREASLASHSNSHDSNLTLYIFLNTLHIPQQLFNGIW
jgi:hypothetical protein